VTTAMLEYVDSHMVVCTAVNSSS